MLNASKIPGFKSSLSALALSAGGGGRGAGSWAKRNSSQRCQLGTRPHAVPKGRSGWASLFRPSGSPAGFHRPSEIASRVQIFQPINIRIQSV